MSEKEAGKEVPEAVVPSDPGAATSALAGGLFRRKKASANLRKRRDAEGDAAGSDDDDGSGVVRKTKQAKGGDGRLAFTTAKAEQAPLLVEYEGSKALQEGRDNLAFRSLETETEYDRDARYGCHGGAIPTNTCELALTPCPRALLHSVLLSFGPLSTS